MIKEIGLEKASDEEKDKVFKRSLEIGQKAVLKKALETLSETDKKELDKVLEQDDADKTMTFLQEKIPNYDEITKQEISKFKRAMLSGQMPA